MGTELVERRQVSFDSSAPTASSLQFLMNAPVPGIDFSSTFAVDTVDRESGVAYVLWTFRRKSTGQVIHQEKVPGKQVSSCNDLDRNCYRTSTGEMFAHNQSYSFSNCRMTVEKESLATEKIQVTADVTNMAGLSYQVSMEKDDLTKLNGTQAYFPPQNVTAKGMTSESCTVTWSFPPACFDRTALWVIVNGRKIAVHKDATEFRVTDLEPGTEYTLYMVTDYVGDEQSDRVPFKCITKRSNMSTGSLVAILVSVIIVSVIVVVVMVFVVLLVQRRRRKQADQTPRGSGSDGVRQSVVCENQGFHGQPVGLPVEDSSIVNAREMSDLRDLARASDASNEYLTPMNVYDGLANRNIEENPYNALGNQNSTYEGLSPNRNENRLYESLVASGGQSEDYEIPERQV
ncbi:uncharacterized protein [Littorina saxatilis]|uniref:uncharacterized protein n=1 Tax=Littorina saxatilis TaxID=31220 RepID=UPI0038B50C61